MGQDIIYDIMILINHDRHQQSVMIIVKNLVSCYGRLYNCDITQDIIVLIIMITTNNLISCYGGHIIITSYNTSYKIS